MQNFSINSVLHFKNKEYQLRTSNNGRLNKIVCSLFRNGGFINSKEIEYSENKETDLLAQIKKFHEDRKKEIELFFNLSQRLIKEGNPELLNMLGVIFHENNLHTEAVEEYLKAIENAPEESQTFNNMGKSLFAMGKYDHAIKAFEKAIRLNPEYVDYYNNIGKVYLKTGACKAAVDMFDKAIAKNNYYSEAYFNRAIAFILNIIKKDSYELTLNYKDEIRQSFEHAILMNPSYQNVHYYNAMEMVETEKPLEALEELKLAREEGSHFSYVHDKYDYYLKILFCEKQDSYELIWNYINYLQELLKKYPGHADIYNDLGTAYCILRNYMNEKAIANFMNALKINPDFDKAKRNLKLSNYERIGSEIFVKAITNKNHKNGKSRLKIESPVNSNFTINEKVMEHFPSNNNSRAEKKDEQ